MNAFPWLRAAICCLFLALGAPLARAQEATLDAPDSVPSGSEVKVKWTGSKDRLDTIGVVPKGAPDDAKPGRFGSFTHGSSPVLVLTPEPPGEYELRLIANRPRAILARRKLSIAPVTATLAAPDTVAGGTQVKVTVTGPGNQNDRIAIVPAGAAEGTAPKKQVEQAYRNRYVWVNAPEQPGEYELRYLRGQSGATLASRKLTIAGATASVHGPGSAIAGATVYVAVTGPHGQGDWIGVFPASAPAAAKRGPSSGNTYGNPQVPIRLPEQPGEYEIRYVTGETGTTLARESLSIAGISALEGPGKVTAGERFTVSWQGPGGVWDQIVIAQKNAPAHQWLNYGFVSKRNSMTLKAPTTPGPYELRYLLADKGSTLARTALEVVPAQQEPGLLRVNTAQSTAAGQGAVEIILDTSGSMLEKVGAERRIDIAKQTLRHLTSEVLAAGTPFALRVFGREAKSCESELDIPLQPLDPASVGARVGKLGAKSNAKTPIAASLEQVASDLKAAKGERLVVLVTDGEETCGGDPRRAIEALRQGGIDVRVNIVGFALNDDKLAATFRQWSMAGNGAYFDARDAAGLKQALSSAVRPAYEVLDAKQELVAEGVSGGEPIALMPGTYTVQLKGQKGRARSVTVKAKQTASVEL